jgi:hypothetical protein
MSMWDQVTDEQRDELVTKIVGAIATSHVPEHLREGLVRYFADGILPGGFLQAVLCNDLEGAVHRHCGGGAAYTITVIRAFLIKDAPPDAWGSVTKVLAWTTTPNRLEIGSWPR